MHKLLLLSLVLLYHIPLYPATVDTVSIDSPSMHKKIKCVVIVPDSGSACYPVVYLLHGYSGYYDSWIKGAPAIKEYADQMHMMIVCPDGGYNSWYYDSPVDTTVRYDTHVIREVLPYIDAHYPTIADRHHRAITGLSMGGHGALYLALKHTDLFGAAGSTSGGVDVRPFKTHWELMKRLGDTVTCAANWDSMTVMTMVDRYPVDSLAIIFDCGTSDFFHTVNRSLHEKLLSLHIPHDYIERPGVHNWDYWRNAIEYQLVFFKNYFKRNSQSSPQ